MKLYQWISLLGLLFCTTLGAFAQNLQQHIPPDQTMILAIDRENLNKKVDAKKLMELEVMQFGKTMAGQSMGPDANQMVDLIFNSQKVGVDLIQKFYVFGEESELGKFYNMLFRISDAGAFEEFIGSILPEGAVDMETDDFKVTVSDDMAISWNDRLGLLTLADLHWNYTEEGEAESLAEHDARRTIALGKRVESIMNPSGKNLSGSQAVLTAPNDVALWMDYKKLMALSQEAGMSQIPGDMDEYARMGMELMKGLYEDTYWTGTLNMNVGAIEFKQRTFMNPAMTKYVEEALDAKINKRFRKYIPAEAMAYYAVGFNMENAMQGLRGLLMPYVQDIPMVGNMAGNALDVVGILFDEDAIYNLFKGDMIIAVTDIREFEVTETVYDEDFNASEYKSKQMLPEVTLMFSTGSESNTQKLIDLGKSATVLQPEGNYYKLAIPGESMPVDVFLAVENGIVFLTNNEDLVANKLSKGYPKSQQLGKMHRKMLKKHSMAFFLDLPGLIEGLKTIRPELEDPSAQQAIKGVQEVFQSVTLTADKEVEEAYTATMKLQFADKDRNSLEQLLQFVNEMFLLGGPSM